MAQTGDHAPDGEVVPTPYPGGKNGWYRAACICGYAAWEAVEAKARRRRDEHLTALGYTQPPDAEAAGGSVPEGQGSSG